MADKTISMQNTALRYHRASDYRVLSEIIGTLAVRYPMLEVTSVGTSVLDRPIPVITIGKNPHSRSLLYIGGIHPTDTLTPAVLLRFIGEYAEALDSNRRMYNVNLPYLYENRTICIIPMLNPDGYEIRRHGATDEVVRERLIRQNGGENFDSWRGNARGVDLWRNFTECPATDTDSEIICPAGTAGLFPESEPECAAVCNYLRIMDEIVSVMSFHAMSNRLRYFTADYAPSRSRTVSRLLSRMTGCIPDVMPTESAESGGSLTDRFIREKNRPAFEFGCLSDDKLSSDKLSSTDAEKYHRVYAAFREALFSAPLLV